MGSVLLKQVKITDSTSPFNGKEADILLDKGVITQIAAEIADSKAAEVHNFKGCMASPGWLDLRASVPDPGFEYKEDIESVRHAAAAGGFTAVCVLPDTKPVMQSKTAVEYLVRQGASHAVELLPLGAVTKNLTEDDITEMYDMKSSGAVAFSNGNHAIQNAGVMHRALLYAKNFNGVIYSFPYDETIAGKGQMAEGKASTYLGMKGIPAVAEFVMVQRDIELARYNNTRLHISKISTAESVALIRKAKAEGVAVTADVAIANLAYTDESLSTFDSNLKVMPPLRSAADIEALVAGLKDGTIDAICSDHTPEDVENKVLEFDYAAFGAIQLQTLLPLALKALEGKLSLEEITAKLSAGPRKVLGMEPLSIKEGSAANITVFNPQETWVFDAASNRSKSANSFVLGQELKGRVRAVFNKGNAVLV